MGEGREAAEVFPTIHLPLFQQEVKEEPKPKEKEEVKEQEQEQPKETKIAPRRPYNNRQVYSSKSTQRMPQNQSRNKYYHRNVYAHEESLFLQGPHPGDANYLKDRHTKATDKKEEEEQGEFDYVTATNKFEEEKEQAKETIVHRFTIFYYDIDGSPL